MPTPDLAQTVETIRFLHRQRKFAMGQRKRADLALGSFLRLMLGWRADLPAAEAAEIRRVAAAWAQGEQTAEHAQLFDALAPVIEASHAARAPYDAIERDVTKRMEKLAKSLAVWGEWGEAQRGFGARSLAVIVGEAGDIGSYRSKSTLWKRMGLGLVDGDRQGAPGAGASAEDWQRHGYNASRRAAMFVIGDVLVKVGDHYREVYLRRKAFECAKAEAAGLVVLPSAKITKALKPTAISEGQVHKRAQRYMEKQLLRDLRNAWRRAEGLGTAAETANRKTPSANPIHYENESAAPAA